MTRLREAGIGCEIEPTPNGCILSGNGRARWRHPWQVRAEWRVGGNGEIEREARVRALDDSALNCRVQKHHCLTAVDELAQNFDAQVRSGLSALWEDGSQLWQAGLDGFLRLGGCEEKGCEEKSR